MDEMPKAARVVPRLAVGALALAIGVVLLWPWVEEKRAIARLSSAGLSWYAEKSKLRGSTDLGTLDGLGASLRTLQPKLFHLDNCHALENVDGLKGLTALEYLHLAGCTRIPRAALRELEVALPDTKIRFPERNK